jgi:Flp pilus assembly protein TadB
MAISRKPAPLWLWIVAAACFAIAGLLNESTLTRVLFLVAAASLALTAVLQWRMRRGQGRREP